MLDVVDDELPILLVLVEDELEEGVLLELVLDELEPEELELPPEPDAATPVLAPAEPQGSSVTAYDALPPSCGLDAEISTPR